MPKENWLKNQEVTRNFIPPEKESWFPGMGFGEGVNYVPDEKAGPSHGAYLVDKNEHKTPFILHPEQEKYGIDHVPGTEPKPRKRDPGEGKMQPF